MTRGVADKKPIRTASEIRSAAAGTLTALRADMKKATAGLADAFVSSATDELFSIATNPAVDGPYDQSGEASVTLKLNDLDQGQTIVDWLKETGKLPVDIEPIFEAAIRETFKDSAQLEVVDYTLDTAQEPVKNSYGQVLRYRPDFDTYELTVKLKDPEFMADPVLSKGAAS
jgi:hypothetical protein